MNKIIYLFLIVLILFSYKILESIFKKYIPKLVKFQLWDSKVYYSWGLVLMLIYLTIRPIDYITKVPVNNELALRYVFWIIVGTIFICLKNDNVYYPHKNNKLRCFHYGVILPVFEEVAFRGLILPMTILLFGYHTNIIIILNGVLFMLFHLSYWSFEKKTLFMFLNFFLLGIYYIQLTLLTQSIIYSILCHVVVNGGNTLYRNWKCKNVVI